ncbi:pre-16S rRNA-processing nuclease YqgF [Candidatus Kaiserbacteria bacterium]|nr:pre-16S rRNA-processing nuclease YqgF [Candidatus Kaiserbacteria bacterium]
MRYLGIDYGTKRVGLAVSSEDIAFPHGVIENNASLFVTLCDVITKEKIGAIAIGDSRAYGGGENIITKEVEAFTKRLKVETGLPIESMWEAGSSIEAARYADGRPKDDSAAAAIILQRYLDMRTPLR